MLLYRLQQASAIFEMLGGLYSCCRVLAGLLLEAP